MSEDKNVPPASRDTSASSNSVSAIEEGRSPAQPDEDDAVEKVATGASLAQVPSQAHKLGKKKVFIVMFALCVCMAVLLLLPLSSALS